MVEKKFADYTAAKGNDNVQRDTIFVYWRSPAEVSQSIFRWAKDTGRIGSIETVIDIIEDEFNKD